MNNYTQKIKSWYEKISAGKVSYETSDIKPSKEWKIMLSLATIALVILAILASYFYMKVEAGEIFTVINEGVGKDAEIDANLLKKVVGEIKDKETFLNKIKSENLVPSDPSI